MVPPRRHGSAATLHLSQRGCERAAIPRAVASIRRGGFALLGSAVRPRNLAGCVGVPPGMAEKRSIDGYRKKALRTSSP